LSQQSKNVADSEYLRLLDGGKSMAEKNQFFFEIAWEVANQGTQFGNPQFVRLMRCEFGSGIEVDTFIRFSASDFAYNQPCIFSHG